MKYTATIVDSIDSTWLKMPILIAGDQPTTGSFPPYVVCISKDQAPHMLVYVYPKLDCGTFCFNDLLTLNDVIVIGIGRSVHFAYPNSKTVTSFTVNLYFGHFYTYSDKLFIASADRLYCFDNKQQLVWESPVLAVDGVIVDSISDRYIIGQGEMDPPGGWQTFTLSYETGKHYNVR